MSNLREEIEDILDNMPYEDFGIPDTDLLVDQILILLDKEIHKARIEELLTHAPDWVEINDDGTVNPTAVFDRIRQLEKGE